MRYWFQIEFNLTNSVSLTDGQVHCWDPAKKPLWMHKRSKANILAAPWSHKTVIADKNKGFGYYDVITNFEMNMPGTAHLVGLRAVESPNRFRAVTRNPGYKDIMWSTKAPCGGVSFYPLYDWNYMDIWKYIGDNNIRYHRYYDFCALKGIHPAQMRVSSLTHEKAYRSIASLPEFEPETYEKLLKRIKGVSFAQETAKNKKMFMAQKLPKGHSSWREYRDFLIKTYPDPDKLPIFIRRFSHHLDNEFVARQQCRQLVLNDYENDLPVKNTEDPIIQKINFWRDVL